MMRWRTRNFILLLLVCCVTGGQVLTPVYDELLWTKEIWKDSKVENALLYVNPSDLEPKLLDVYPSIRATSANSLDGPHLRRDGSNAPEDIEDNMNDIADIAGLRAIDVSADVKPAAEAAMCSVCHVLTTKVWQRATALFVEGLIETPVVDFSKWGSLSSMRKRLSNPSKVVPLLEESCKEEAADALLKHQTILQLGDTIAGMNFFVIRERKNKRILATGAEKKAVRLACKRLIQDSAMANTIFEHLEMFAKQLDLVLLKHQLFQGSPPNRAVLSNDKRGMLNVQSKNDVRRGDQDSNDEDEKEDESEKPSAVGSKVSVETPADDFEARMVASLVKEVLIKVGRLEGPKQSKYEDDYNDEEDDGSEDPLCLDLHPLCLKWADAGECDENPKYMVGSGTEKGNCRKACGVCTPRKMGPVLGVEPIVDTSSLAASHPSLESDLQLMLGSLLQAVRSTACTASKACMAGPAGAGTGSGFIKAAEANVVVQPTGWKLGTPFHGQAIVSKLSASKLKALEDKAKGSGASGPEPGSLAAQVDEALSKDLKGKVMSVAGDFFIFEYLYKNHTRQYHEAENGDLTEDYILGHFQRESVNVINASSGAAVTLEDLDLLPNLKPLLQQKEWPYVKQVYPAGEECVLAGNRRVVRKTEARIVCSPDSKVHMLVREPQFCHYVFVIYSPAMCSLDKFKPLDRAVKKNKVVDDDDDDDDDEYV